MAAASETTTSLERVRGLAAAWREPSWLCDLRLSAWQQYADSPLPDRATHLWRYSDPKWFEANGTAIATRGAAGAAIGASLPAAVLEALGNGELAGAAMLSGGRALSQLGDSARKANVALLDLRAAVGDAKHGPRVQEHLARLVGPGMGRVEARNTAVWDAGMYLHVPAGVDVAMPIHLLLRAGTLAAGAALAPRLLVIVEQGARLTLVEEHAGNGATLSSAVTEIVTGPGAQVTHVLAQRLAPTTVHHGTQRIELARDAQAVTLVASLGAKIAKLDLGVLLRSPGSRSQMMGFLFGDGRQHFDHHTELRHSAPHSSATIDFKTVLTGKARSAYTGLIRIDHEAPYSEAYQENRNLLLSEDARAESIPELEIAIDEVQCKHGATVGPVRPDELFYLMSRGISRADAIKQIVEGFLEPTLARMPEELTRPMRREVEQRLNQA